MEPENDLIINIPKPLEPRPASGAFCFGIVKAIPLLEKFVCKARKNAGNTL